MICICRDFCTFLVDPKETRMTQKWKAANFFSIYSAFMRFLSNFDRLWDLECWKRLKRKNRYPGGPIWKTQAVFSREKSLKLLPKWTKVIDFSHFYSSFVKLSTDLVAQNASNWNWNWQKFQTFSNISKTFSSNFYITFDRLAGVEK